MWLTLWQGPKGQCGHVWQKAMWPCVARGHVTDQSESSESRPVLTATALLLNSMMGQKHLKKEVNNGSEDSNYLSRLVVQDIAELGF